MAVTVSEVVTPAEAPCTMASTDTTSTEPPPLRRHHFDGRFGFGFGPVYPYYGYYPPAYGYEAPAYWYYCPSYGAYYPNVASCPEAWVPVPAS